MEFDRAAPILRIFDEGNAREFYLDYLGMTVDFEHRFNPESPLYMQVTRGALVLHLSEHHADGTPGTHVLVDTTGVAELHHESPPRITSAARCRVSSVTTSGLGFR